LAVAWSGLSIGGVTLLVAGGFGVLTLHAPRVEVTVRGAQLAWWLPVAGLALVAAALAYAAGVAGARRLGPKVASFVGLSEVLFASIFAWLLLGQRLGAEQIAGGLLVIAGIALVRLDERAPAAGAPAPTRPEASPLAMAACRRLAEPAWVGDGAEGRP
jgi:drug/metabolite transporter (DMT)-like permease